MVHRFNLLNIKRTGPHDLYYARATAVSFLFCFSINAQTVTTFLLRVTRFFNFFVRSNYYNCTVHHCWKTSPEDTKQFAPKLSRTPKNLLQYRRITSLGERKNCNKITK